MEDVVFEIDCCIRYELELFGSHPFEPVAVREAVQIFDKFPGQQCNDHD